MIKKKMVLFAIRNVKTDFMESVQFVGKNVLVITLTLVHCVQEVPIQLEKNAVALKFSLITMVVYLINIKSIIKLTFLIKGCCGNCPSGYTDTGCTCFRGVNTIAKSTYGRGVGYPLKCPSNKVQDGALCYDSCKDGFKGVGPVCWGVCPDYYSHQCGALCVKSASDCATFFLNMGSSVVSSAMNLVAAVGTGGTNVGAWINTYSSTAKTIVPLLNDGLKIFKYQNHL